ncbi:hypothetical protein AVEN_245096-1 [Araneus ventricosus]|uniref:Gustatory receptor n=1 Tax=Araneus ventricosus TaxID=182803 RepID=A0A4Y2SIV3_ARAVE|nr:hypothetical protein AVEN_245096-1 [Araneus ventricosus]
MRRGRYHLTGLLSILSETQKLSFTWIESVCFYVVCSVPMAFAALNVVQQVVAVNKTTFDVYGQNGSSIALIIFNFVKSSIWAFIYPTSVNLIVLLYCFLCQKFCRQINRITRDIRECRVENFTLSKQANVSAQEARIGDFLHLTQRVFSVPSFWISAAHFCSCITVLGSLIVDAGTYIKNYTLLCQSVLLFLNSSGGLLACLWTAGGLPLAEGQMKDAFRRKMRERLHLFGKVHEECFQKELMQKPSFLISGCLIVYFQRSSILYLLGTILTYSFLLATKAQSIRKNNDHKTIFKNFTIS